MENLEHGRYEYNLERVLHEKARLSIMTSLFTKPEGYSFNDLKELCNLTDGNLSRHIQILKESGLIEVIKGYEGNKPNTVCKITENGKQKYTTYVAELEKIIKDAMNTKKDEKTKDFFSPDFNPV